MPKMVRVNLTGKLQPLCCGQRRHLGGTAPYVRQRRRLQNHRIRRRRGQNLTVPERATITNMGAELGATTFCSFLRRGHQILPRAQGRRGQWVPVFADEDAQYDEVIDINLSDLVPMAACPHSPDNVKTIDEIGPIKVDQVCIGSCTNSSYLDLMRVAAMLKGKTVHPDVSLAIAPGSKQVFNMIAQNGALADMIAAGARILESACGPCIGMGQSPQFWRCFLRTFNRNFEGVPAPRMPRSIWSARRWPLLLPSPAFSPIPTPWRGDQIDLPEHFLINDNMVEPPASPEEAKDVKILLRPQH